MPELPELEVVREVLERHIIGQAILGVEIRPPGGAIVVRDLTGDGFKQILPGKTIAAIHRRGKFVVFTLRGGAEPFYLAINPKLSGRLQLAGAAEKLRAKTPVVFKL